MNRRKQDKWGAIARIVNDVRFMLPMLIVMTGGTAYNFEPVRNFVNGDSEPLASVEDVTQPLGQVHPEVARSIKEIVEKLKSHDSSLKKLRSDFNRGDGSLDARLKNIEELVQ